ncbi:MAG: ABC transporter substrate-binding protein [Treponema sp.]|jgi:iron complex transport system substrate-binding protein|nr:ABC transporter substrate-binding protein [Treponema sp.]
MKKLIVLFYLAVLLTGILAGCRKISAKNTGGAPETAQSSVRQEEAAAWPRTITDALGHEVLLTKKPERITLLRSFYLEHFLLIGAPPTAAATGNVLGEVEALEQSEMYAPYLKDLEMINLGSAREINLEAILESAPDVIVGTSVHGGLDRVYDQLVRIAPVALFDFSAPWQEQLLECAGIVGRESEARNVIAEIETVISSSKEIIAQHRNRTLALFRTDGKIFMIQGLSKYYEAFDITRPNGFSAAYENISLEAVAEMNPYYIIFQHNYEAAASFVKGLSSSSVWRSIDAVKNGRIYYFDENMNTYGPLAMRLAAEKLARIYSGEL